MPPQHEEEKMALRAMDNIRDKYAKKHFLRVLPSGTQIKEMMKESAAARRGVDWVNKIGENIYILYGHKQCDADMLQQHQKGGCKRLLQTENVGVYPLQSCKFLRLAGPTRELERGKTKAGTNYATWHCAACCEKWTHARDAQWSLLVAGHDWNDAKEGDSVFCAYIGSSVPCLNDEEHKDEKQIDLHKQIQLLKGATLRDKIEGKSWTKEHVLKAIHDLNVECEEKLGSMANVVEIRSANWKKDDQKFSVRKHYCEDERLSIG
jgi:hypothetical protein